MVIDTSALVAIERLENDAEALIAAIERSDVQPHISAVPLVEAGLVLSPSEFEALLADIRDFRAVIVNFTAHLAYLAIDAAHRYGKGRGKRAQLNFGDCCSYATAKALGMPLLFKGGDFTHTDIKSVPV
jgi:ribonuclease VapC